MPGNFHEVPEWVLDHWPEPNYVDPVRRSWLPAFSMVLPAVSTVLISGRFWLRATKQAGTFGLDDVFIAIGWSVSIGFSALAIIDAQWYGLDRHTWDVKPEQYPGAALTGWWAQILFLISTCATKTSVLLFYRRMVAGTYSKRWLFAIWAALAFLGGYFISILFAYCFICRPLSAYWASYNFDYDQKFTCINGNILSPFVGALSVFTDVYAVVLPCAMLARVNLDVPRRQKMGLNVIFALGLVVAGFGVARTYYLWEINNTPNYDTSWTGFELFVWSLLECHFAIIFACAPSLRAFVRRYLGDSISRTFGSSSNRSRNNRSDGRGTAESGWQNNSTMRRSGIPMDNFAKQPAQQHMEAKPSKDTLNGRVNFYQEESATPSTYSEGERPIRSADEYEAYAVQRQQMIRHAYHRSLSTKDSESVGHDWNDPRYRFDSDNAV